MDFFARQDSARHRTALLVVLFVVAVVAIVVLTYLVVTGTLFATQWYKGSPFDPALVGGVTGGVLAIVGGGSVYKIAQLRGGGTTVAQRLGGGLV
ncbi:MAG: peptidase M48, partial [Phycisphaerae bacterium]|nr:peptidase M48 [Phycisphaerae bacterium]